MTIALIPNNKRKISPSSMNTYFKCPRLYYYKYIKFLPEPSSIHLVKGSVVHTVLQLFFSKYETDLKKRMLRLLDKYWKIPEDLTISNKEEKDAYKDVKHILLTYLNRLGDKYKSLLYAKKVNSLSHAFYLTRPKFREVRIENKTYNLVGVIDTISTDFNGKVVIGDYKTGSTYGLFLSEDVKRQLAFYSLLYYLKEGSYPDTVVANFLRYGEKDRMEVTPSLIKYIVNEINTFTKSTQSDLKSDYPKNESGLCSKYCAFFDVCAGHKSITSEKKQELKEVFGVKK